MENQAKEAEQKLITNYVRKSVIDEYQQIVSRTRNEVSGRCSKAYSGIEPDGINTSSIINISNHLSSLNTTTLTKNSNINTDIYKSDTYRVLAPVVPSKGRASDLNSTGNVNEYFSPPVLSPAESMENGENQNTVSYACKIHNNNLLFSFEGFQ